MRLILAALLLAGCDDGGDDKRQPPTPVVGWEIGPTIDGRNYSTGSVVGSTIEVRDVHYVTRKSYPLTTGSIRLTFTISAPITMTGAQCGGQPANATLYFQARGDDWNTDGKRWWATFATVKLDRAGQYSIEAPLDGAWTSVYKMTAASTPAKFADAKTNAERVGFTLGNCEGYGHGGTGPATLTIDSFQVG